MKMTFDAWMRSVNPLHEPTDDGMETRLLRSCWVAAVAAERERWHPTPSGWLVQHVAGAAWEWYEGEKKPNEVMHDCAPLWWREG